MPRGRKSLLIVSFIIVFLWFSYTNPIFITNADRELEIAPQRKEKSAKIMDSFPINHVVQNSIIRKKHYSLSKINYQDLQPVSRVFFRKWFDQIAVTVSSYEQTTIHYTSPGSYYFFDHKDLDSVFLFTLFENLPEYNTYRLYHFTVDKHSRKITCSDWVAAQGGNAYYFVNEYLTFNSTGNRLRVNSTVYKRYKFHKYSNSLQTTFGFGAKKTTRKTVVL